METRLNDLVECPFCRPINADARKCERCHELIGSSHKRSAGTAFALLRFVLDFVARIAIRAKEIARVSNQILHLYPNSFHYLIGAAEGIVLHYEHVYEKDKGAIDALVSKGLAELKVIPEYPDSPFAGAKLLEIVPTEAGKQLLQALGVKPRSESGAEPSTVGNESQPSPNKPVQLAATDSSEFRRLVKDIAAILGPTAMRRAEGEERRNLQAERPHEQGRPSEEEAKRKEKTGSRKNFGRKYFWRTYGPVAVAVAVMLIIFSFVFWPKRQASTEKVIVLVADFDGPDLEVYSVTKTIFNNLELVTSKYDDVEIQRLYKPITDSKTAQTEGKKRKAIIVIWGWYWIPSEVVPMSVHFELLNSPKEFPALGQASGGSIQKASIADLKSFTLQPRLSTEMNYLSLFVLGIARRAAGDGNGAIDRFSDALDQKTEPSSSLNRSIVYFHRGVTSLLKGDSDLALADLNQAIKLQPAFAEAYANRTLVYFAIGDYSNALVDANEALQLKPAFAIVYNTRGLVHVQTGDYDQAIADFSQALKLAPDHAGTYNNRGWAYAQKGDFSRALADVNQAIKLKPDADAAYYHRGVVYRALGDHQKAIADFKKTLDLTKELKLHQDAEKQLRDLEAM